MGPLDFAIAAFDDFEWAQDIPRKTFLMSMNAPIGFRGRSFQLFRMGPRHSLENPSNDFGWAQTFLWQVPPTACGWAQGIPRKTLPMGLNGPIGFRGRSLQLFRMRPRHSLENPSNDFKWPNHSRGRSPRLLVDELKTFPKRHS